MVGARASIMPTAIVGLLFFVFGSVTWLNGSLVPFLKVVCALDTTQALLVTFAFYIAYTVMALPMAAVLARTGYRRGMALGLAIMAGGALIHVPAAWLASFPLFLVGLFTLGTGLTILQTASNPYIVLLGPPESAARRISLMGVINKTAGVLAPLAFASLVLSRLGHADTIAGPAARHMLAERLVGPYLAMAAVLALLVVFTQAAPLPELAAPPRDDHAADFHLLRHPRLVLGVVTLFAYMGVEVVAGDTIGLFGAHLGVAHFLSLTSYTMAFMVVGYLAGILLIPHRLGARTTLRLCGAGGVAASLGAILSAPGSQGLSTWLFGWAGVPPVPDPVLFVAAMGFVHALVWPTVWPIALSGLGDATPRASALLVMAISGGAVVPLAFGWLSARLPSMQMAYLVAIPCYAMILFYGWRGCTMTRWRAG
jgi:MFS transporter, FHS family, L-fucose permease